MADLDSIEVVFFLFVFFSIIISDAILQQEVNVSSTKLIQACDQISYNYSTNYTDYVIECLKKRILIKESLLTDNLFQKEMVWG